MSAPLRISSAAGRPQANRLGAMADASDVVFRVLFSVIFVTAGAGHLVRPGGLTVDLGHTNALGPLFKHIALLGGLVHFAIRGPGAYSVARAVGTGR
jgi:uncharacterized membrane protein YphA (DoxX/SURF4 family)